MTAHEYARLDYLSQIPHRTPEQERAFEALARRAYEQEAAEEEHYRRHSAGPNEFHGPETTFDVHGRL